MDLSCYGHYPLRERERCRSCRYLHWCRTAGDPVLLTSEMSSYEDDFQDARIHELAVEYYRFRRNKLLGEQLRYSRNDLLEMMVYILNLTPMTLSLLSAKIADPELNFAQLAKGRNRSRQAVQQAIIRKLKENPELSAIFNQRARQNRRRKQLTFMEVVCQIRHRRFESSSKKPANNLKFYRSLNSWNRNFNLSKMNTIKGSRIFPAA